MRKLVVLASTLAVTGAFGYISIKRVEGKMAELLGSDRQTRAVVDATTGFLNALNADQRQKVQFAFVPQKAGTNAPFHRTADGGVAPGAPTAGQQQGGTLARSSQHSAGAGVRDGRTGAGIRSRRD